MRNKVSQLLAFSEPPSIIYQLEVPSVQLCPSVSVPIPLQTLQKSILNKLSKSLRFSCLQPQIKLKGIQTAIGPLPITCSEPRIQSIRCPTYNFLWVSVKEGIPCQGSGPHVWAGSYPYKSVRQVYHFEALEFHLYSSFSRVSAVARTRRVKVTTLGGARPNTSLEL